MKNLLVITVLLLGLSSCDSQPILDTHEYTVTDTTYFGKNGFNMILEYDIILFNHYDSSYHAGSITPDGKLIKYNPRPIKTFKYTFNQNK